MKKFCRLVCAIAAVALAAGTGFAETVWTVNDAHTTISDGTWTLNVAGYPNLHVLSVASGNAATLELNDNYVDSSGAPLAGVHIYDIGGTFSGKGNLTTLIIDLPELRRLGRGAGVGTFAVSSLKSISINAPKCEILGYRLFNGVNPTESSFDNWNLPNLRRIEPQVFHGDGGNTSGPTGTLHLPLLDDVDMICGGTASGFSHIGAASLILGDATLPSGYKELTKSFVRATGITNLELLSRSLTTIRGTCICGCSSLKTLTLGGTDFADPLSSDTPISGITLDALTILGHVTPKGTLEKLALAMKSPGGVMYVSRNQGWSAEAVVELGIDKNKVRTDPAEIAKDANFKAAYDALTEEQLKEFICVVNANSRYFSLVHKDSPYELPPAFRLDAHVADDGFEEIAVSPAGSALGVYEPGAVVTLVAPEPTLAGTTFAGWTGDVPDGADLSSRSLTVTMDRPRKLRAHYARKWVYDADAKTFENGFYRFSTTEDAEGGLSLKYVFGQGDLHLTDDIVTPDGEPADVYLKALPAVDGNVGILSYVRVPNFVLEADQVAEIGDNICRGGIVTNFVFDSRALTKTGKCPFYDDPATVARIVYGGEQITSMSTDNPFKCVSAKEVCVYGGVLPETGLKNAVNACEAYAIWRVSRRMGWGVMAGLETDLELILANAAHKTAYNKLSADDRENLIGLYTYNSKYVWFVHTPSKYESADDVDLLVRAVRTDLDKELLIGTVTPPYGQTTQPAGTNIEFSIEELAASAEVLYRAIGYVTATQAEDQAWYDVSTNYVRSFTYTVPEFASRITWLLEPCGHRLDIGVSDGGFETVAISETPYFDNYFMNGTVVVATASDPQHSRSSFVRWIGDVPAEVDPTARSITFTMDRPRNIQTEYLRGGWTFDAAKMKLSDGNWLFDIPEVGDDGGLRVGNYERGTGALRMTDDIETPDGTKGLYYIRQLLQTRTGDSGFLHSVSGLTDFYLKADHVTDIYKNFVRDCVNLTNFVFDSKALTTIDRCIFHGSSKLKKLTLGGEQIETVAQEGGATGSFPNMLVEMTLLGRPLTGTNLYWANNTSVGYARWYVSRALGWKQSEIPDVLTRAQVLANKTHAAEYEKLSADDQAHLIGLHKPSGGKEVWLIHRPSPYYIPGLMLFVW